jgi:hypothetical protein
VLTLGGADISWSVTPIGGEVLLDSVATIKATDRFLRLLHPSRSHPRALETDWDNVIDLLQGSKVGVALPFSDTTPQLNTEQFGFAPFRLLDNSLSPVLSQLYAYPSAPLHIFTTHIIVAVTEQKRADITAFFRWFLTQDIQNRFRSRVWQSPLLDRFASPEPANSALHAASVAQRYAALPQHSTFAKATDLLPAKQQVVLDAISILVRERKPTAEVLGSAASTLRRLLLKEKN